MLTMRDLNKSLIQELLLVDLAKHNAHVRMKTVFSQKRSTWQTLITIYIVILHDEFLIYHIKTYPVECSINVW